MASSRTYIPSVAALRVLLRPAVLTCPHSRRVPTISVPSALHRPHPQHQQVRAKHKRTPEYDKKKAKKQELKPRETALESTETKPKPQLNIRTRLKEEDIFERYLDSIGKDGTTLEFYEQLDQVGADPVLRKKLETQEDVAEFRKTRDMFERGLERKDPIARIQVEQYAIDEAIKDPKYSHLREEMESFRPFFTRLMEKEAAVQEAIASNRRVSATLLRDTGDGQEQVHVPKHSEAAATLSRDQIALRRMRIACQTYINDPEYAPLRQELEAFVPLIPADPSTAPEGFAEANTRMQELLAEFPPHQATMAKYSEMVKKEYEELEWLESEWNRYEKFNSDPRNNMDEPTEDTPVLNPILKQLQDFLAGMGIEKGLQKEIQEILDNGGKAPADDDSAVQEPLNIDPRLQKQIDAMLADPEKLLHVLDATNKAIRTKKNDITSVVHDSPPDPATLPESDLATYAERRAFAQSDPEHSAAMRRLVIHLLPPFNVRPEVKRLNEALQLTYCGGSDQVRRATWRAYMKARTVPTLLQNIPDDAWDLLWYSQGVRWASNPFRDAHLRVLMEDLQSVGRDGPPTHPSTLPQKQ